MYKIELNSSKERVFYSELPSRNVYVDAVVNELPGYYPARSEFGIEFNNDIEQDLTDVCAMYDELVNNKGEESDEDVDPLRELLSKVKKEPENEDMKCEEREVEIKREMIESDTEVLEKSENKPTKRKKRRKKCGNTNSEVKKRKLKEENSFDSTREKQIKREDDLFSEDRNLEVGPSTSSSLCDKVTSNGDRSIEVFKELCIAAIEIYNNRLRERNERKAFVRNHGFLDQKKIYSWYNIHNLELGDGVFNTLFKKFIKLFDTACDFDKFIQQLKLERELKMKLLHLAELRRNGIRHKKMIPLYTKLKASCNKIHGEIRNLDISDIIILNEQLPDTVSLPEKRAFKTLEIFHLENYKLLNEEEKELCSIHRLTPSSYLSFKQILIDECKKLGNLKLAQARTILKIDVNKTRKVYNYLIEKNLIWKE